MGVTDGGNEKANGDKRETGNAVPVAAGAGDSNICGGIIQLHWDQILERCLDLNDQVRQTSLKVYISCPITLAGLLVLHKASQHSHAKSPIEIAFSFQNNGGILQGVSIVLFNFKI